MTPPKWRASKYRKIALSGLVLSGLFLTAGCSAIQSITDNIFGGSENTAIAWASEPAGEPIWTVETRSAGNGPQIVGDTALSYIWEDGHLGLAGYDLETGEQKWFRQGTTGGIVANSPLRLRLFESADGTALVANILEAQQATPTDEQGRFRWGHPYEVLEVETGEVRGTSPVEPFIIGSRSCVSKELACSWAIRGETLEQLGMNENAELVFNPDLLVLTDYESVSQSEPNGFAVGVAQDGTLLATLMRDGEPQWTTPMSEMGFEGLTQTKNAGVFDDFDLTTYIYEEEGVVISTGGLSPEPTGTIDSHTAAFDLKTGETLWQNDKYICLFKVFCNGNLAYERDSNSQFVWSFQDIRLAGFDLRTGEETWAVDVAGMRPFVTDNWELGGDGADVINTSDGQLILDTSSGKIVEITEEQSFHCQTEGEPFRQVERGVPNQQMIQYKKNPLTMSCGLSGESNDPSTFSKATVAYGSETPYGIQTTEWDTFEEQTRVIATKDGFAAYRF